MSAFVATRARWAAQTTQPTLTLRPFWLLLSACLALTALWAGAAGEYFPYLAIPIGAGVFAVTMMLAVALAPQGDRNWLVWLVAIAFFLHLVAAVAVYSWLVHKLGSADLFADERTYEAYSRVFADSIRDGYTPEFRARNPGYYAIVTGTFLAWGDEVFWPRLINVGVSALLLVPVYGLAHAVFDRIIARRSALVVAFAPSLLVFPAFLLKDLYIAMLLTFIAWKWVELVRGAPTLRTLVGIAFGGALTLAFRLETATIMIVVPLAWLIFLRPGQLPIGRLLSTFGMLTLFGVLTLELGLGGVLGIGNLSTHALGLRQDTGQSTVVENASDASLIASFVVGESLTERLLGLPAFVLQPLIQPIPTFSNELSTLMAPGMLFTYAAFPFIAFGAWRCIQIRPRTTFLVWGLAVIFLMGSYLSLYIAFRYRIQYEPLLLILAVAGFSEREHLSNLMLQAYVIGAGLLVCAYAAIKFSGLIYA